MSCVVGVRRRVGRDGVEGRSAGTSGRVGVYTVQEPGKPRQIDRCRGNVISNQRP